MSKPISATTIALVTATVAYVAPAHAQKSITVDITSSEQTKTIEIPVSLAHPTMFYFPHAVNDAYSIPGAGDFEIDVAGHVVGVMPHRGAKRGAAAIVTEKWNIGAAFVVVEDPADAVLQVEFRDVDTGLAIGKELMFRSTLTPVTQEPSVSRGAPSVELSRGRALGDNFYAHLLIHNDGRAPLRIDVNHVDAFAAAERIEGARMAMVDAVVEHVDERTIAVISPGQVGHAMLWLPNVSEDRATPLTVRLHDIGGQHELKVAVREWEVELDRDDDQPLSAEEYQDLILSFAGDVNASARPFADHWTDGRDAVTIRSSFLAYGSETGVIAFKVTNDGQFDFSLDRIAVQDTEGDDVTAAVKVVGRARGDIEGPIQPGETLTVAAVFRDAQRLKSSGMVLKLFPMGGGAPVAVNMLEVVRRQANKGRTSVIVSGGGGVLQLERGDAGSALVGAWGLGGQLMYGVSGNFSLDIGLSGLVSGESDIAGLARSERLYRLHGGVRYLIRDDGWIPYARVGGGAALVAAKDGDDSSLAFGAFGQLSAGITRWLADSFVLGAEASAEFPFAGGGGASGIASIYLGFAWGGNEF